MATPKYVVTEMTRAKDRPDLRNAPPEVVNLYRQFYKESCSSKRAARRHPVYTKLEYLDPSREATIEDCMTDSEYIRIHHGDLASDELLVVTPQFWLLSA